MSIRKFLTGAVLASGVIAASSAQAAPAAPVLKPLIASADASKDTVLPAFFLGLALAGGIIGGAVAIGTQSP